MFTPLVQECKKRNRAMRIGTNHGSLSARTLSFYGDTPRGMVESAIEFADICRANDYHNFVFSMKASNPLVMVQAYRLLAAEQARRQPAIRRNSAQFGAIRRNSLTPFPRRRAVPPRLGLPAPPGRH